VQHNEPPGYINGLNLDTISLILLVRRFVM
jgi:hypothetical protein